MTERSTAAVTVDVMVVGQVPTPHAYVFRPEGGSRLSHIAAVLRSKDVVRSPCLAYVVHHPAAGPVLIDTGLHPDASQSLRKDFGTGMALLFRNLKPADQPFTEQLRNLGVDAGEVERVIMTHLHVDHTSGMRLLPKARFTCSRTEWAAAMARNAGRNGYVRHHLPDEQRVDLVDFANDGEPYKPFTSTVDLLGDGTIRLISTPGHTRGHMSVLLRVPGGQVLVVGDAVYTTRSLHSEILPLLTADDRIYLASVRQLKAFAQQEPEAVVVPSHDPTAWRALPAAPAQAAKLP